MADFTIAGSNRQLVPGTFTEEEPVATVAGSVNTVLQIDGDGDGFGGDVPDESDYFLVVQGADLSLHHGYILT